MDNIITRSLLRSFHNKIKDSLGIATDQEINDILDGIDFVDVPTPPVDLNKFQIYDVWTFDYHWYIAAAIDANSIDNKMVHSGNTTYFTSGKVTNKDDEFVFSAPMLMYCYIKQKEYANTRYLDGFVDTSPYSDNCTTSRDDALMIDGKYVVVLHVGTPYDEQGPAFFNAYSENRERGRTELVGGTLEVTNWNGN